MVFAFMRFHFAHPRVPHPYQTTLGAYQFHDYVVRRIAALGFIAQMPRVAALLELADDVVSDRVALGLGEPLLEPTLNEGGRR